MAEILRERQRLGVKLKEHIRNKNIKEALSILENDKPCMKGVLKTCLDHKAISVYEKAVPLCKTSYNDLFDNFKIYTSKRCFVATLNNYKKFVTLPVLSFKPYIIPYDMELLIKEHNRPFWKKKLDNYLIDDLSNLVIEFLF